MLGHYGARNHRFIVFYLFFSFKRCLISRKQDLQIYIKHSWEYITKITIFWIIPWFVPLKLKEATGNIHVIKQDIY